MRSPRIWRSCGVLLRSRFVTEERGDSTTTGLAIGAILVLLVVVVFLVYNGSFQPQQQPGVDIRVGT